VENKLFERRNLVARIADMNLKFEVINRGSTMELMIEARK